MEMLVIETAFFAIPKDWDPTSNMFIAVAAPTGGLGSFPALVQGDPGPAPTLLTPVFTALEATDPTPDSAVWTETTPGTFRLDLALHKGLQGDPGDTLLTPTDFGTPLPGKMLVVDPTMTTFVYQTQKVGDRYVPAALANTPAGNTVYTLGSVPVPAQDFDWRPDVSGQCIITATSYDVRVDLVARLNGEVAGNIVGRGLGMAPDYYRTIYTTTVTLASGPPTNASSAYDKVAQGVAATVYLRAERIAGSGTFTTTATDTSFCVRVRPIPYGG